MLDVTSESPPPAMLQLDAAVSDGVDDFCLNHDAFDTVLHITIASWRSSPLIKRYNILAYSINLSLKATNQNNVSSRF